MCSRCLWLSFRTTDRSIEKDPRRSEKLQVKLCHSHVCDANDDSTSNDDQQALTTIGAPGEKPNYLTFLQHRSSHKILPQK